LDNARRFGQSIFPKAAHVERSIDKKGINEMKSKISSIITALLVSLCFQGCKSIDPVAEENLISSLEIGKGTKQDALNMLGKPHNKSVDKNGYEHWVYEFNTPKEDSPSEIKWEKMELIYDGEILKDTLSWGYYPALAGKVIETPTSEENKGLSLEEILERER
jgi:outer membrane protein assembly factor BamE (lipoprotein component of BamABCDE complex)